MVIAVASGKGGTGKTTVATNLAAALAREGPRVQLLDCDVEEPNCHIFVKPEIHRSETVGLPVPNVDTEKCTGCGECGKMCQYSAIVCIKRKVLTFAELCHGCGGCSLVCPEGAIAEQVREVGVVEIGQSSGFAFVQGRLHVKEAMSPPLIRAVKGHLASDGVAIIDAPPGTSCPVIVAVKGSDFVALVTEPTPFGLNDLRLAVETVRELAIPFGVVINRVDVGDDRVVRYCEEEGIQILAEIPDDRRVAEEYSRGRLIVDALPDYVARFLTMFDRMGDRVRQER